MRLSRTWVPVIAAILICGSGSAAAEEFEIYTCRDEQGNISMQNDPCPEMSAKKVAAPVPNSEATKQKKKPAASSATRKSVKPKPRARAKPKSAPRPEARPPDPTWIRLPSTPPARRSNRFGKQTFPTRLDAAALPDGPSYVTPEKTWRTFLAALDSGDAARALDCLTTEARRSFGPDAGSFPLDEIRAMVRALERIEDDGRVGPFWSIYGAREGRQPKWIFFEQVDGGWKIAGI